MGTAASWSGSAVVLRGEESSVELDVSPPLPKDLVRKYLRNPDGTDPEP